MPRGKKGSYALAEDGDGGLTPVRVGEPSDSIPAVSGVQATEDRASLASFAFEALLLRTDGWIRVVPCGEGKTSYFKYKYASGKWKGYYVMYVGNYSDWSGGLLGLYEKVTEVDTGTRKPAYDTFYDPR